MNPHHCLRSIVAPWMRGGRRKAAGQDPRRWRPAAEALESRRLLSTVTEFPAGFIPSGIVAGPDSQLWFAGSGEIGSIDPMTHALAKYALPADGSDAQEIAVGPDRKIWFTVSSQGKIGTIDPTTHQITEFSVPTEHADPEGITAGPDGRVWFTEPGTNKIGTIDPTTHAIVEFPLPASAGPWGIVTGPDGELWFTESGTGKIGTMDLATREFTEFPLPKADSGPEGMVVGPDGNLWFTEAVRDKIGSIDPVTHAIDEMSVPTIGAMPRTIAVGPEGLLWFTENGGQLGTIDPVTHFFTETGVSSTDWQPGGISAGPDDNFWFTDPLVSAVGFLASPLALVAPAEPPPLVAPGAPFGLTVAAVYPSGLVATGFDGPVSLTLLADAGDGSLGGATTVFASRGVASFSGLTIDRPGTYRLEAVLDRVRTLTTTTVTVTSSASAGGPAATGGAPTIVAAGPILTGRGRHKHLAGFELDFSTAMDPARAASAASYSLVQFQRRHRRLVARPVRIRASYDAAAHRVELTVSGRPKFAAGGKLVVFGGAGGLVDAAGAPLGDDATFAIALKGKRLS